MDTNEVLHTATRSSTYILPSDEAEKERLLLQHRILKKTYENRLFLAPVTLAPGDHVLDSGTGGASWLLDLARRVSPEVFLHGIDIESRIFPSNHAPNIHLSTDSITKLPASWSSTFTLVHQRHLILGLTFQDWQAAFKEMYRIIIPGGWVNLLEGLMDVAQYKWTAGPATLRLFTVVCALILARGMIPDLPLHLPALLEEAGFINIHVEERGVTVYGQEGADMRENTYRAMMTMKALVMNTGGLGFVKSAEEYENLVNAASKEWSETPEAAFQFFVVYAQKPSVLS
ncbi:hypothetical protein PILCRDRAFT_82832 [Piloderma croceum F 1598]|uniref:Methyltransferase domain-containing protein n=1 Tax=Piloderma croceum (strain F 1598) TaxID=765440 RepID=A0A0C3ETH2_PILCF|nr:hypothetical protein PILCRDRAFT_82832 [Piloderma croceum F 1598]